MAVRVPISASESDVSARVCALAQAICVRSNECTLQVEAESAVDVDVDVDASMQTRMYRWAQVRSLALAFM